MSQDRDVGADAMAALRRGDASTAMRLIEPVERSGRATPPQRLMLARSYALLGDIAAATSVLERMLAAQPDNLYALIMRGDLLIRAGDERAAVSWYQAALLHAPRAGRLPADLIEALRRVESDVARLQASFQSHLAARLAASGLAHSSGRFAEAVDILQGAAPVQLQRPTSFYYPQLAQRPFFEREEFAWTGALEAAAPAIRRELTAVIDDPAALTPYVTAEPDRPSKAHPLLGRQDWSAFHLYCEGQPIVDAARRCPAAMSALTEIPLPQIAGRSPMALFSVLRPRTHIPPHNGMLNTRLICHLPLIVPDGCRLRVGNETRRVEAGRTMIFDDSIEHEAWNDSDETRIVLLFEIWRPELDEGERSSLTILFEAIGDYAFAGAEQADG